MSIEFNELELSIVHDFARTLCVGGSITQLLEQFQDPLHSDALHRIMEKTKPIEYHEIVGSPAIVEQLRVRKFNSREIAALISFTQGPGPARLTQIINGLNDEMVVQRLQRVPNVGLTTVRSVLHKCLELNWIQRARTVQIVKGWLG